MSPRFFLVLLTTVGTLGTATADAAGLSTNLSIRSPGLSNATVLAGPRSLPTPKLAPPLLRSSANDPYDTSTNLNPGGGGGGTKPSNKPSLQ
jgi:hypothetical protein